MVCLIESESMEIREERDYLPMLMEYSTMFEGLNNALELTLCSDHRVSSHVNCGICESQDIKLCSCYVVERYFEDTRSKVLASIVANYTNVRSFSFLKDLGEIMER